MVEWKGIAHPIYPVKITRKRHIRDYCEWYFKNVRKEATASEMASYAVEAGIVRNNICVDSRTISGAMRGFSKFKRNEKIWSLKT